MFKPQPAQNKARYCVTRAWTEVWVRVIVPHREARELTWRPAARASDTGIKVRDDVVCINTVLTRVCVLCFKSRCPFSFEKNNNGQELVQQVHRIMKLSPQQVSFAGLATATLSRTRSPQLHGPDGLQVLAVS